MNIDLAIAGLGWLVLAFGHTAVGVRWVLPNITETQLPSTPFGPPRFTLGMLRFTWYVVSVLLLAFGILFMTLAWATDADPKTLVLRWFVALLLAVTALAFWEARRRLRSVLRLPVPLVFVVIAVLSWTAST
jgi:hypothetical protein